MCMFGSSFSTASTADTKMLAISSDGTLLCTCTPMRNPLLLAKKRQPLVGHALCSYCAFLYRWQQNYFLFLATTMGVLVVPTSCETPAAPCAPFVYTQSVRESSFGTCTCVSSPTSSSILGGGLGIPLLVEHFLLLAVKQFGFAKSMSCLSCVVACCVQCIACGGRLVPGISHCSSGVNADLLWLGPCSID